MAARKADNLPELVRVAATARELVDRMGDIVWLIQPAAGFPLRTLPASQGTHTPSCSPTPAPNSSLVTSHRSRRPPAHGYRQDLYLLFQEALRNTLRHSGCRRAELSVTLHGRDLEVELRDDGHASTRTAAVEGLETMSRAERLGGRLRIDSSAEGTVVRFVGRIP